MATTLKLQKFGVINHLTDLIESVIFLGTHHHMLWLYLGIKNYSYLVLFVLSRVHNIYSEGTIYIMNSWYYFLHFLLQTYLPCLPALR